MHVGLSWGLDAYSISNGQFRYAVDLFRSLDALDEDAEFTVFGTRESAPAEIAGLFSGPRPRWHWRRRPQWNGRGKYFVDQVIDGLVFRGKGLDVLHCIDSSIPRFAPCPVLWTLHDLAPEVMGAEGDWRSSRSWRRYRRDARSRVARHLAISQATADDAVRFWGVDPGRITVVHHGTGFPPPELFERPNGAFLTELPLPQGEPFLCAAYNLYPRKNIDALLDAMGHLRRQFPDLKLVLFGRTGISAAREAWFEKKLREENLAGAVVQLGFLDDLQLADLYRSAAAFVFPSLYEGFGLPLLEAMTVGACVVARNRSSMAEVVGDGGLLVETQDGLELARGIERLLCDADERERLSKRGRARASEFSLAAMARKTFDAYRQMSGESSTLQPAQSPLC